MGDAHTSTDAGALGRGGRLTRTPDLPAMRPADGAGGSFLPQEERAFALVRLMLNIGLSKSNKMYELVPSPVENKLTQVIKGAEKSLFVAVPYIKNYGVELLTKNARTNELRLITNFSIQNVTGSGFDIKAMLNLWDRFTLEVSSLQSLHAKVYIADGKTAFITSANLTRGGLVENYEYGIVLQDKRLVTDIVEDMNNYFNLGNIFSREKLTEIISDVDKIKILQKQLAKTAEAKQLQNTLQKQQRELETRFLANRVESRTINAIFSETIVYLIRKMGPLGTKELHPLIQNIHPDICDDSIDRVINGQHFGKKWKHLVRNAQQYLKQNNIIKLEDDKWRLTASTG